MGANPGIKLFDEKAGLRIDGRKKDEIRPITIEAGVLHRADGSAYLEWGKNKIMAAVYGPREFNPRRFQQAHKCVVRARYNMAAFSVSDRKRPGPDRRSAEIGKVISDAFENVVLTEKFPRGAIDIQMEILQADAGTRIAALVAATVALADAGIPMKGLVAGCAAGKAGGHVILDLDQPEDNFGEADVPIAVNMTTGDVVLFQMDGHLTAEEYEEALDLAKKGCEQVYAAQRKALLARFEGLAEAGEAPPMHPDDDVPEVESKGDLDEKSGGRSGRGARGSGRSRGRAAPKKEAN
jgi:exosome complex component RRP41